MMRRDQFLAMLDRHLWKWLGRFVVIVLLVAAARSSIGDWSVVPSRSMTPTILPGDRIYVNKLAYDLKLPFTTRRLLSWSDPRRGDVVILYSPRDGAALVKRIAAIPGDRIDGRGDPLPPGKYFVRGDNAAHSFDSRSFGPVSRDKIIGRAVGVMISLDPERDGLPRWQRLCAFIR